MRTTAPEKKVRLMKTECDCARCQQACNHAPGWFRPGEAEKAATLLGLSLPVFFKRYLVANWWEGETNTFVLAPATVSAEAGREAPVNPKGTCVFYKGGRCQIHAAKPYECSHGNPCEITDARIERYKAERVNTVKLWSKRQPQIEQLLGHKPQGADYSFLEAMFW
jgi:Fe-S-cluster containining protein